MIDVEKIIKDKIGEKVEAKTPPYNVSFVTVQNEVLTELKKELNNLFREGKIAVYDTVNGKAIELK